MKKSILAFLLVAIVCPTGFSQQNHDSLRFPVSIQTFDIVEEHLPFLQTENPTAISILNIKYINLVEFGYSVDNNDIRYTHQPGRTASFIAESRGFKSIGKTSFYGSFSYANETYNYLTYNSTLVFDSWNPFIIGDTIDGRQTKEEFDLAGNVSYRLSDKIALGCKIDYESAEGAKHNDPRNKNEITRLKITPGMMYDNKKWGLGLNASYYDYADEVDIDVTGTGSYTFFIFSGLGFYMADTDFSYYATKYIAQGYSLGSQFIYHGRKSESLLDLNIYFENQDSRYGSNFRYNKGSIASENYNLNYNLKFYSGKAIHTFNLGGGLKYMCGDIYSYLSNTYTINGQSFTSYEVEGIVENAVIIEQIDGELSYTYTNYNSSGIKNFSAGAAAKIDYFDYGKYPVENFGYFSATNVTTIANITRNLTIGKFLVAPSLKASLRLNLAADMYYKVGGAILFPELITKNYNAMKSSVFGGALSFLIEKPQAGKVIRTLYFKPEAAFYVAPDLGEDVNSLFCNAIIGFTF